MTIKQEPGESDATNSGDTKPPIVLKIRQSNIQSPSKMLKDRFVKEKGSEIQKIMCKMKKEGLVDSDNDDEKDRNVVKDSKTDEIDSAVGDNNITKQDQGSATNDKSGEKVIGKCESSNVKKDSEKCSKENNDSNDKCEKVPFIKESADEKVEELDIDRDQGLVKDISKEKSGDNVEKKEPEVSEIEKTQSIRKENIKEISKLAASENVKDQIINNSEEKYSSNSEESESIKCKADKEINESIETNSKNSTVIKDIDKSAENKSKTNKEDSGHLEQDKSCGLEAVSDPVENKVQDMTYKNLEKLHTESDRSNSVNSSLREDLKEFSEKDKNKKDLKFVEKSVEIKSGCTEKPVADNTDCEESAISKESKETDGAKDANVKDCDTVCAEQRTIEDISAVENVPNKPEEPLDQSLSKKQIDPEKPSEERKNDIKTEHVKEVPDNKCIKENSGGKKSRKRKQNEIQTEVANSSTDDEVDLELKQPSKRAVKTALRKSPSKQDANEIEAIKEIETLSGDTEHSEKNTEIEDDGNAQDKVRHKNKKNSRNKLNGSEQKCEGKVSGLDKSVSSSEENGISKVANSITEDLDGEDVTSNTEVSKTKEKLEENEDYETVDKPKKIVRGLVAQSRKCKSKAQKRQVYYTVLCPLTCISWHRHTVESLSTMYVGFDTNFFKR